MAVSSSPCREMCHSPNRIVRPRPVSLALTSTGSSAPTCTGMSPSVGDTERGSATLPNKLFRDCQRQVWSRLPFNSYCLADLGGGHARTQRGFNYLPLEGQAIAPAYGLASNRLGWRDKGASLIYTCPFKIRGYVDTQTLRSLLITLDGVYRAVTNNLYLERYNKNIQT